MDFFTGMHLDYHEPTDTFDKLNLAGMRRVEQFVEDLTVALADGQQWPDLCRPAAPFVQRRAMLFRQHPRPQPPR